MKENKTWIAIGITLFVGAMTRRILNSIGGIKSLPYWGQISIVILMPIIYFMVIKKQRKKMNKFQYKVLNLCSIFFTIMMITIMIIIVLNNSFPAIWKQYRTVLQVIIPVLFLLFAVYTAIFTLCNIKNIK